METVNIKVIFRGEDSEFPGAYIRFTDLRSYFDWLRQSPETTIEEAEIYTKLENRLEAAIIARE